MLAYDMTLEIWKKNYDLILVEKMRLQFTLHNIFVIAIEEVDLESMIRVPYIVQVVGTCESQYGEGNILNGHVVTMGQQISQSAYCFG